MAEFDYQGAKDAGYSDTEIQQHLLSQPGVDEAKKAGYSEQDILAHYGLPASGSAQTAAPTYNQSLTSNKQETGPMRYVKGAGSELLKGAEIGVGQIGDLVNAGGAAIKKYLPPWFSQYQQQLPGTNQLLDLSGKAGLTDRADLVPGFGPNPETEKLGAAAARGVGEALPLLALGNPEAGIVKNALAPVAGSMAGELAHEAKPDSKLLPLAAGLATGTVIQAGKSLFAGNAVKNIAEGLGDSRNLEDAGAVAQKAARTWLSDTMPAKMEAAWAPLDKAIPKTAPMPVTNFESALESLRTNAGELQPLADKLAPSLPAKLQDIFKQLDIQQNMGTGVSVPVTNFGDVQALRSVVGSAMGNPSITKDIPAQQLAALYGALSEDMKAAAGRAGVGAEFEAANKTSKELFNFANGTVGKIVAGQSETAKDPLAGLAARRLLTTGETDGSQLAKLRSEMPEVADELAAAHLQSRPERWNKLTPSAQAALVPDPALRGKIAKATADLAAPPTSQSVGAHTMQSVLGLLSGKAGAEIVSNHLGIPINELYAELLGTAAPQLARGAKSLASNPGLLRIPLQSTIASGNALFPNPNEVQQPNVTGPQVPTR